ncbi:hypothetical protein NMY22_g11191 [Coprinellus aureogranulatus]|nr:hypothetical protein NMY22_g11191 [Coprinellus aureogranulatus]
MSSTPALFSPIKVGNVQLKHRVALAPLTRFRATRSTHVPVVPLVKEYYAQRGSVPGTLLVTEATFIAPEAGGYRYAPGIWNKDQIKAWKECTQKDRTSSPNSGPVGRAASPDILAEEGNYPYVSASDVALSTSKSTNAPPRPLTHAEIDKYYQLYATAAKNAVEAGFDGVEIHGANGYLIDQFLQDVSNKRTDEYGGSIENRSRFGLRVVDAIVKAIGAERTAIRLSPWGRYQDMRMADPVPQFSHFVSSLAQQHPNLAYVHLVEPARGPSIVPNGPRHGEEDPAELLKESNDFVRKIWAPRPLISCTEYTRETALEVAEKKGDIIGFGRLFISNPDLPFRLQHNLPLTTPDQKTFYTHSDEPTAAHGYVDYPFSKEFEEWHRANAAPKSRFVEYATYAGVASLIAYNVLSRL